MLRATDTSSVNLDTRTWPSREWRGSSTIQDEVNAFVEAALSEAPSPVPGEDGLAAVGVVEKVHKSLEADGLPIG